MTESESVALPFGDSPLFCLRSLNRDCEDYYTYNTSSSQALF
jgi:hypothetical protein